MTVEGILSFSLDLKTGEVDITSSRPLLASHLFEGKKVSEALRLIPLLFNICGQAQGVAAIRAVESAANRPASLQVEQQRERLNMIEMLREHLCRVLLDWPLFSNKQRRQKILTKITSLLQSLKLSVDPKNQVLTEVGLDHCTFNQRIYRQHCEELQQTVEHALFGMDLSQWQKQNNEEFTAWIRNNDNNATYLLKRIIDQHWQAIGATGITTINALSNRYIAEQLDGNEAMTFIAQPHWHHQPLETGVAVRQKSPLLDDISRHHGNGLLHRLVARLNEIIDLIKRLNTTPAIQEAGIESGLACVEAVRGRLWHQVKLDGGHIERYRILAPTEWNFHPQGVAAKALSQLKQSGRQTVKAQAELIIHAIDPCVGYSLQLEGCHA